MARLTNSDDKPSHTKYIYTLLCNIPKSQHSKWFTIVQLCDIVNKCGARSVSKDDVLNVTHQCNRPSIISCNRYLTVRYYCVGDDNDTSPKKLLLFGNHTVLF